MVSAPIIDETVSQPPIYDERSSIGDIAGCIRLIPKADIGMFPAALRHLAAIVATPDE